MNVNMIKVGDKVNYEYTDNEGNKVVGTGKVVDVEWCQNDYKPNDSHEDITVITEDGEEMNVWNYEVTAII